MVEILIYFISIVYSELKCEKKYMEILIVEL